MGGFRDNRDECSAGSRSYCCFDTPKVSVSILMGCIKGKLAIKLFKTYPKLKQKGYWGNHFWSRGYFVNMIGIDEDMIRRYVKYKKGRIRTL